MTKTVLILGPSGKIGSHAAEAFWNAGWSVRRFDRGSDMTVAAKGADVIVNGLNPPNYHDWATILPALTRQVIDAAKTSGATVILPGNVYNFGNQPGVLDEHTPQHAHSRKGKIRVQIEQMYKDSGVQTIILRGGNFIDPLGNGDIMSMFLARSIGSGKLTAGGDPGVMQPYCYVPDMARAMQMLADRQVSLATFEDVPFPGHAFTLLELQSELSEAMSRPVRITRFPWWAMRMASPFWELARELMEMRYLWDMPHSISGAKFQRLLPDFVPTPKQQVMRAPLGVDIDPDQAVRADRQPVVAQ
ncbi:NAD-dependent epimerase/dehydratase family protein [Flavimaricola marinus]|uniref:NAD-dependent epimerase/dehydratase domain-containing protein n=1 Tax=Flavimaricola marinus TaxID=1819565 RepID=A0A238LGS8_9RHOB|nr:NAD-dependent epimerase/dehydratase family protein [Flavimaricola marinus]SMY08100.1 hypothetical protein LOM8899_02249 [Flavimaricola marinus]